MSFDQFIEAHPELDEMPQSYKEHMYDLYIESLQSGFEMMSDN